MKLERARPAITGGDNYTIALTNQLLDYGLTVDTTVNLMLELWDHRCVPPWYAEPLRVKVQNAWNSRTDEVGRDHQSRGFERLPADLLALCSTVSVPAIVAARQLTRIPP